MAIAFVFINAIGYAQYDRDYKYLESEMMIGYTIPVFDNWPETGPRKTISLSYNSHNLDTTKSWASYYNFPKTGVSFLFSDYGNNKIFGKEFSVVPVITFPLSKRIENGWNLKYGLGMSYFTKKFNERYNPVNVAVSTDITWFFLMMFYKNWYLSPKLSMNTGFGFLHSSNGHTTLPNIGHNSVMFSVSFERYRDRLGKTNYVRVKDYKSRPKQYFVNTQIGVGFHEYGGAEGPINGPKLMIYSFAVSYGKIVKDHVKLKYGMVYRHYDRAYNPTKEDSTSTKKSNGLLDEDATNFYVFFGAEFLIGHVGMNIESGFNLYKPYYNKFHEEYNAGESAFKSFMKKKVPMKLGLNYYLISNEKKPKNNFYVGVHVAANWSQADFTDFSIGYTRMISK